MLARAHVPTAPHPILLAQVYVNGVPYTRRELEMPAAALHHAGVHAGQVRGPLDQ